MGKPKRNRQDMVRRSIWAPTGAAIAAVAVGVDGAAQVVAWGFVALAVLVCISTTRAYRFVRLVLRDGRAERSRHRRPWVASHMYGDDEETILLHVVWQWVFIETQSVPPLEDVRCSIRRNGAHLATIVPPPGAKGLFRMQHISSVSFPEDFDVEATAGRYVVTWTASSGETIATDRFRLDADGNLWVSFPRTRDLWRRWRDFDA